jgi:hypothetical protein
LKANETDPNVKVCPENRQRLIFLGKELKNNQVRFLSLSLSLLALFGSPLPQQVLVDIGFDEVRVVQVFLRPEVGAKT